MRRFLDKNRMVWLVAGGLAVLALLVWGYGFMRWRESEVIFEATQVRVEQLDTLLAREPALTPASLTAAEAHLHERQAELEAVRAGLQAEAQWTPMPAFRGAEELYFEILNRTEAWRSFAAEADLQLPEDFGFGFARLLDAGQVPTATLSAEAEAVALATLHRQLLVMDDLVHDLLAAEPTALLALEREAVVPLVDPSRALPRELFTIDPQVSASVPGEIETLAVRLVFTGRTETLRRFLQYLGSEKRPVIVGVLEVEPLTSADAASRQTVATSGAPFARWGEVGDAASADVPIVEDNLSRFTLVVEAFEILPRPKHEAAGGRS